MINTNVQAILKRNDYPEKDLVLADKLTKLAIRASSEITINQMSMQMMGHIDDRLNTYVYNRGRFEKILNRLARQLKIESNLDYHTPILTTMDTMEIIEAMLNNVLFTVIFFTWLLSYILINSLMQTDVEERRYEFGVMRTLGLKNQSLITLISVQTLFFSIPGIIGGFSFMFVLVKIVQHVMSSVVLFDIEIEFTYLTFVIGIITGLVIPFISNVKPMKSALKTSLRNALDKMRPSLNDLDVEMVRYENASINYNTLFLSILVICLGVLFYYSIPKAAIERNMHLFLYLLNVLLLMIIIGCTLLAQLLIPYFEVIILDILILFKPQDKILRPIIIKNFESHGKKNLMASLMFVVTLAFLVFTGANFKQIEFFLVSMSKFFAGANITA